MTLNSTLNSPLLFDNNTIEAIKSVAAANETYIKLQITIDTIVSKVNLVSMIFGTFGNLICLCVLCNRNMLRKKYHYYLLSLAFSDFCFCAILASYYLYFEINEQYLYDIHWSFCYLLDYVYKSFDSVGVILTLIVSIDRTYAVRNPMDLRSFFTYRFPKSIAIVTTIFVFIIRCIEIFYEQMTFDDGYCNKSKDPSNPYYTIHNLCDIIITLFLNFVPALIIMLINFYLWHYIITYKKTTSAGLGLTRRMSTAQNSHYLTIIIIGVWLLLTSIPYHVLCFYYKITIMKTGHEYDTQSSALFLAIQGITSAFFNLNRCINIIIYMCFNKDFQGVILPYLTCCTNPVVGFCQDLKFCNNPDNKSNFSSQISVNSPKKKKQMDEESAKPMLQKAENRHSSNPEKITI